MHNLVNLVCRDARPDRCSGDIQHLSRQAADLSHALLALGVQLGNLVRPDERPALFGNAVLRVVGVRYRLGHLAPRRERVDWPQRAGEVEGREGVVVAGFWIWFRDDLGREEVAKNTVLLLVSVLVRGLAPRQSAAIHRLQGADTSLCLSQPYPVLLEAVLGAEVAVLDAQAQAFWALERAGIILAVDTEALPLRWGFFGHGVGLRGARRGGVGRQSQSVQGGRVVPEGNDCARYGVVMPGLSTTPESSH